MLKKYGVAFLLLISAALAAGCKKKVKVQSDQLYSRHLQRQVNLSIISTPMPDDKTALNVLLLNDGQDIDKLRVKEIIDSLYKQHLIQPLIVVGLIAGDRDKEYGVSGLPDYKGRGSKADKYAAFIEDELYPYAKKKAGVRKFKTVVLAGCAAGGLSAFDVAWDHADKIDKAGIFSGSFLFTSKSPEEPGYTDANDRILLNKIRGSRKKPTLQCWMYGDDAGESGMRHNDSLPVNDTKDLLALLKSKNLPAASTFVYTESKGKNEPAEWSEQMPAFLLWAFGK